MKISVIFTGGTIGSQVKENGYIATQDNAPYKLIQMYEESQSTPHEFNTYEPYRILSENLSAKSLMCLVQAVSEVLNDNNIFKSEGIIITHGTDTLQYSAAMLSYLFADVNVPIILVSSAYVLDDPRANGFDNFKAAIEFISSGCGNGVFVSYRNNDNRLLFHRGNRLILPGEYSSDIDSILNAYYAELIASGEIEINPLYNIEKDNSNCLLNNIEDFKLVTNPPIMCLHIYPGMSYPSLTVDLSENIESANHTSEDTASTIPKAILIQSYHSGTLCIDDNLKSFAMQAKELDIPFYLTGLDNSAGAYETVAAYNELGIIPLYRRSFISQYCRLWIITSNNLDVKSSMFGSCAEDNA